MSRLLPRKPVPALSVLTLNGETWDLSARTPSHFTMIVFYRGLHCPVCRTYIGELDELIDEFSSRGVEVIAISSDTAERARETQEKWKLTQLNIGYGLMLD